MRALLFLLSIVIAAASFAHSATSQAPVVAAKSYLLLDYHSQQTLASRNPN